MDCKQCGTVLEGRQREFCSDKCRKRASRSKPDSQDAPQSTNADTMVVEHGQNEVGQQTRTRPPIPGDDGYVGVCKQVDGQWVVKPDPSAPVSSLSDVDLQLKLKSYQGASWVNSPEHKEVLRRRAAQPTGAWT